MSRRFACVIDLSNILYNKIVCLIFINIYYNNVKIVYSWTIKIISLYNFVLLFAEILWYHNFENFN